MQQPMPGSWSCSVLIEQAARASTTATAAVNVSRSLAQSLLRLQLAGSGVTEDMFSLCFGSIQGDGALLLGNVLIPPYTQQLRYTPMVQQPGNQFYMTALEQMDVGNQTLPFQQVRAAACAVLRCTLCSAPCAQHGEHIAHNVQAVTMSCACSGQQGTLAVQGKAEVDDKAEDHVPSSGTSAHALKAVPQPSLSLEMIACRTPLEVPFWTAGPPSRTSPGRSSRGYGTAWPHTHSSGGCTGWMGQIPM